MKGITALGELTPYEYYHRWFTKMASNRSAVVVIRKEDEEFYYSDIEGTRTQFTKEQLTEIEARYDIPISTKISYAILEQILSFLSGTKPYPRLIAPSEVPDSKQFTEIYEQAHNAVWYESKAQAGLTNALRDCITTGSGFMHTRRNNFFQESTFNVINEHIPWTDMLIDPSSRLADFSDAEMMCIVRVMPKTKAEKEYDIQLTEADCIMSDGAFMAAGYGTGQIVDPYLFPSAFSQGGYGSFKNDQYVWTRLFYEKKKVNVYISENGDVSTKRPISIMTDNPAKIELGQAIEQMMPMVEQAKQAIQESVAASQSASDQVQQSQDPTQAIQGQQQVDEQASQILEQAGQVMQQFQSMQEQFAGLPDQVPAYKMETLAGHERVIFNVERTQKKQIARILMVGQKILENDILPCTEFPIVHFSLSHLRSPNRTYSLIHYIKDEIKALNKIWANILYDMMINSRRKAIVEKDSIESVSQFESELSDNGNIVQYTANPNLPDGGRPIFMDASPINQSMVLLIDKLMSLTEYITGIFGVVQGNTQGAPDTFGGMSSLQNFGTQRVKLYGRYIEDALEILALNTVEYLQAYAPRDKVLQYFGEGNEPQEIKIMDGGNDLKFKVRVNIANNLPTARHMAAQMISTIAGQSSNPDVADLLTQYALSVMDVPEADKISKSMDVIKRLQAQLQQQAEQMQSQASTIKSLENQFQNSVIGNTISEAKQDISHQKDMAIAENKQQQSASASTPDDLF